MKQGIALLLFCVFLFGMFFFFWGSDRETVVPSTPEERTKSVAEESANTEKNSMTKTATFKIKIEYCTSWGYKSKADSLSESIKKQHGVSATLVPSSGGVFEVYRDDKLIFSKKQTNRFPTHEEVLKILSGGN